MRAQGKQKKRKAFLPTGILRGNPLLCEYIPGFGPSTLVCSGDAGCLQLSIKSGIHDEELWQGKKV